MPEPIRNHPSYPVPKPWSPTGHAPIHPCLAVGHLIQFQRGGKISVVTEMPEGMATVEIREPDGKTRMISTWSGIQGRTAFLRYNPKGAQPGSFWMPTEPIAQKP